MSDRLKGQQARTAELIEHFRGKAGEFYMLKGVLCAGHVMEGQDGVRWRYFIDPMKIAARMDELNREAACVARNE